MGRWKWYHGWGLVGLVVVVCLVNWLVPDVRISWLLTLCLLAVFTMLVSDGITGRFWLGWLINEEYTVSLARLQMFLWTVVILSSFVTAVSINIKAKAGLDALSIGIQEQLWIAMCISAASLVGSPLILDAKKRKGRYPDLVGTEKEKRDQEERKDEEIATRIRAVLASQSSDSKAVVDQHFEGPVYRHTQPEDASLSDLFTGEEIANFDIVDISRLQAFFFTMILVLTYAINAAEYLAKAAKVTELPALGASGLSLLAISQGIYLTSKAVPKRG